MRGAIKTARAPTGRVTITKEIIAEAKPRDSGYCMVAEAVKVAFPYGTGVAVDIQTIRFSNPNTGLRYVYMTPRAAQIALVNFDQEVLPEPFSITLRNGQVIKMSKNRTREAREAKAAMLAATSEKEKAKIQATTAEARKAWRAHLSGVSPKAVPDKIGGRPPPKAPLSRRRAFGLRALER